MAVFQAASPGSQSCFPEEPSAGKWENLAAGTELPLSNGEQGRDGHGHGHGCDRIQPWECSKPGQDLEQPGLGGGVPTQGRDLGLDGL